MYSGSLIGSNWATRQPARTVLAVVHNVTSATRLFDVIPLIARDTRIQVYFTCTESSVFTPGTFEFLEARGVAVLGWTRAIDLTWDLVIATSHGGAMEELSGPIMILPHGMGYNKYLKSEIGNRKSEIGNRPSVFGMSPDWLLRDGSPIASCLVFSHSEQVDRLRTSCPEAVPVATVAGDPCLDRIQASVALRAGYRAAIDLRPGQKLIFVSSTWGQESLYGKVPDLIRQLRDDLPLDEHVIAVALHPAVWSAHSPWQVREWLAACERSEVVLFPGEDGWRAGLVAADLVIGDYGSVTFYAAALGKPLLLAVWPDNTVDPLSAIGKLLSHADRIDYRRPLGAQASAALHRGQSTSVREIAALASSCPGKAAELIRRRFYDLMDLPEPDEPARTSTVPLPRVLRKQATAQAIRIVNGTMFRYPAETAAAGRPLRHGTHLVVSTAEPTADLLELADIVLHDQPGDAKKWIADTLAALPGAAAASMPVHENVWLVGTRSGRFYEFTSDSPFRYWASVVHSMDHVPAQVRIVAGGQVHSATVSFPDIAAAEDTNPLSL